ncbi:MAG: dCTP deaminase [candidate division NC10 bacterium]|nr:dCTP deaminase [candidate division NC10 bacterium]MBI2113740.1 dCTP deaminase [candidate division NC10 bacterium]MBI3086915.1 dCTP deaminase [candidate division NC10 bacterium]
MILSNVAIHQAIDRGRLRIEPEPHPRLATLEQPDCPYDTTSVDLRLGSRISIPRTGPYTYDLSRGGIAKFLAENCDHYDLDPVGGYALPRLTLVLGQTLESVELPIDPGVVTLAARIEGKSSFARCGLLIHFTAPTVHAGWSGRLTLEMINLGSCPITVRPGMKICQLILEMVDGIPNPNPSQFHGQTTPPGVR